MSSDPAAPYQTTRRTSRARERILDDLASLPVRGAVVSERGSTYLVFSPPRRGPYSGGLATLLACLLVLAVLVLVATSVLWIVLLPAVPLVYVPLFFRERPMLAIGAIDAIDVDAAGDAPPAHTVVTVHGHSWGDLATTLDAYLADLPAETAAADGEDGDHPVTAGDAPAAAAGTDAPAPAEARAQADTAAEAPATAVAGIPASGERRRGRRDRRAPG